jgi:hypothetical protein
MRFTVDHGEHTTGLLRSNSFTGVALPEIYDTDILQSARLGHVPARMDVATGDGVLIAGLAIAGNAPPTVIIPGIGPALTVFGGAGELTDPKLPSNPAPLGSPATTTGNPALPPPRS